MTDNQGFDRLGLWLASSETCSGFERGLCRWAPGERSMPFLEAWGHTYLAFVKKLDQSTYRFFRHPGDHLRYALNYCYWLLPLEWILWSKHVQFLDLFLVFHGWIPLVELPTRRYSFKAQCMWTVVLLGIFLVYQETPIYGIKTSGVSTESVMYMSPGRVCLMI